MAGPRSPFPIRYLDEAIGFLIPRSFVLVVRPLVPSFRSLVPPFLIHRFITPSPPLGKEASLTLGIIYTIIFNTLVWGMPVLRTRNSLNLVSTERGGTKTLFKITNHAQGTVLGLPGASILPVLRAFRISITLKSFYK